MDKDLWLQSSHIKASTQGEDGGGAERKKKKKQHRPEPFQARENSVVGVPNLGERAIDTEEERDAGEERKGEMEGKEFDFRVSRCPFRRCKLTNRW